MDTAPQNPIVAAYIAENEKYLDENSAAALSRIPDAAWPAILAALDALNGGATDPGIDCSVATTTESLADFDAAWSKQWSQRGTRSERTFRGLPGRVYERFQLSKEQQRRSMMVVDLGDFRVALT